MTLRLFDNCVSALIGNSAVHYLELDLVIAQVKAGIVAVFLRLNAREAEGGAIELDAADPHQRKYGTL